MIRRLTSCRALALALVLAAACGGKKGTLSFEIVVSPVDDPFLDATQVRFTLADGTVHTAGVSAGHFELKAEQDPSDESGPVLVEALDAAGNVVARGQSPALSLRPIDQGPIAVWMGRPGRVAVAKASLPSARTELAALAIPGLGVLYVGGRDAAGTALAETAVYDIFTHSVIATSPLVAPRAGASGIAALGVRGIVFGGARSSGLGSFADPIDSAELFDPTTGLGLWAPVPADAVEARSAANLVRLGSGAALISGGADGAGSPLASAALVTTEGTARLSAVGSPMAAPRLGHAVAAARFVDGEGAMLIGGLADPPTGPIAERLVGQTFIAYDLPGIENRLGATATTLPGGAVLLLGGRGPTGALASGAVITPSEPAGVSLLPNALSVPRAGHTATLVGDEVLICGGSDAAGVPNASCDVLDAATFGLRRTIPLALGRSGHTAAALETGPIVLAGGVGLDGAPIAILEIYTP